MSSVGRVPPRPPIVVATVKPGQAAPPHAADPGHAAQQSETGEAVHHHGVHHVAHAGHGHAAHVPHLHQAPHAPKPRRPPKPRKGRRKRSSGEGSDEDELDIGDESHHVGSTPVSFDGGHQDGGDNHDQGDGDNKREDRTLRARFGTDGAAVVAPRRRPADAEFAANRYRRGICDVLVGPMFRPETAARIVDLDLELLRATPGVARIDHGGLARVPGNLLAHAAPVPTGADRPLPDSAAGRANCIAVMKVLQLQLRRSAEGRRQSMAQLEVRKRAHKP